MDGNFFGRISRRISFKLKLISLAVMPVSIGIFISLFAEHSISIMSEYSFANYRALQTIHHIDYFKEHQALFLQNLKIARLQNYAKLDVTTLKVIDKEFIKLSESLNVMAKDFSESGDKELMSMSEILTNGWQALNSQNQNLVNSTLALSKSEFDRNYVPVEEFLLSLKKSLSKVSEKQLQSVKDSYAKSADFAIFNTLAAIMIVVFFISLWFAIFTDKSIRSFLVKLSDQEEVTRGVSQDIKHNSEKLGAAFTEQAAAIQESVASIEEMRSMAENSAKFADRSTELARDVQGKSENSLSDLKRLHEAMDTLRQTSDHLKEIPKILNDIVTKTDNINKIVDKSLLLSFNASIEAARAGEHGKGFSVVAHEIAKLASSSGVISEEISKLLQGSVARIKEINSGTVENIDRCTSISNEVGQVFEAIIKDVATVAQNSQDISSALVEQKEGIVQTTEALKEMDITTREIEDVSVSASAASSNILVSAKEFSHVFTEFRSWLLGHGRNNSITFEKTELLNTKATDNAEDLSETDEQMIELISKVSKVESTKDDLKKAS